MKRLKVGLNGFGRIGRAFTRIALNRNEFDIKLINTRRTEPEMLAYLLKHDSVYRTFSQEVCAEGSNLLINGSPIATSMEANPEAIDWEKHGVEVVVDATGAFTQREDLSKHLGATVKRVILTAPSKDESIPHLVLGVNDEAINWEKEMIISNASCTTNCASPMLKVLVKNFGVASGMLTTIHAMTMTQSMLDDANKKPDRSRSAIANIVPSTSGAAKAIVKTLPELEGKLAVGAVRVPVPTGSLTDLTINLETTATAEEVNMAFKQAASTNLKRILAYENEILVSSDFIGSPYSCIFDANYTKVINNTLLKVMGWYDNEWGYSTRLVDLIARLNSR
jgi:glyceraldehyde 3-phosphate dehydrogenase